MKFPNIMDCQKCNGVYFLFFFSFFLTSHGPSHGGEHPEATRGFARRLNMPVLDGCLACEVGLQVWASPVWSKRVRKAAGGCYHLASPLHSWVSLWPWNSRWSIWDGSVIWKGPCRMFCSHTHRAGHRKHFCWAGSLGHRTEQQWAWGQSEAFLAGERQNHIGEDRESLPQACWEWCVCPAWATWVPWVSQLVNPLCSLCLTEL